MPIVPDSRREYQRKCAILTDMKLEVTTADDMQAFGARIGALCRGGEVIELAGDIGAGKTTFTKGLARALGVTDEVQSPTFTINRVYETAHDLTLVHYDFYRLNDAGVMKAELAESVANPHTITVIEWAQVVEDVLPSDTLHVEIAMRATEGRDITCTAGGERSKHILEALA